MLRKLTFWNKNPPSRIETCKQLETALVLLSKLRYKEAELKKAANLKGQGSIDFIKHKVISDLLNEINNIINEFNLNGSESKSEDSNDIYNLVRELSLVVDKIREVEVRILMTPRDKKRETANQVIYYGTLGGTMIAGSTLFTPSIGKYILLFGVARTISDKVTELVGLRDISPDSYRIISNLSDTLHEIKRYYSKQLNPVLETNDFDSVYEYICPITQVIMERPVICKLDGHSYERDAIMQWLTEHRTSPINREEIAYGETVDSVLIENRNLKSLIDKFRDVKINEKSHQPII